MAFRYPSLVRGGVRALDRLAELGGDGVRTLRFFAGSARFEQRTDDVFVASYPRSGTTWTQLVVHLLRSGDHDLAFDHLCDVSPWWERSLSWRSDAPEAFAALASPRVFKTHLPRRFLPRGARCVYVHRDPGDVVVSYFHLYRRYLGYTGEFGDFFERFLRGDLQYRSYFRHVEGWLAAEGTDVLVVPYEAMRHDPESWVGRVAGWLGVEASPDRVAEVVRLTGFDRMKASEEKFDHVGELCRQWGVRGGEFLRVGQVTRGASMLTPAQRRALDRAVRRPHRRPEWRLAAFLH